MTEHTDFDRGYATGMYHVCLLLKEAVAKGDSLDDIVQHADTTLKIIGKEFPDLEDR